MIACFFKSCFFRPRNLPMNIKQMILMIDRGHVVGWLILLFYPKFRVGYACL